MDPIPRLHVYEARDGKCGKCGQRAEHPSHDADLIARVVLGRVRAEADRVRRDSRRSAARLGALLEG